MIGPTRGGKAAEAATAVEISTGHGSTPRSSGVSGVRASHIRWDSDGNSTEAPRVAADWQGKVRRAFQTYMGRGYAVADFAPTEEGGRRRPLYLLRKG